MVENSIHEAKAATESLLQIVELHADDAPAFGVLQGFLPIALESLQTTGDFGAEVPDILRHYKSTCDTLAKAIQTEDSQIQNSQRRTTWNGFTIKGETLFDYFKKLQTDVQVL